MVKPLQKKETAVRLAYSFTGLHPNFSKAQTRQVSGTVTSDAGENYARRIDRSKRNLLPAPLQI